jgi:DNA-binding NtrC family response regulator
MTLDRELLSFVRSQGQTQAEKDYLVGHFCSLHPRLAGAPSVSIDEVLTMHERMLICMALEENGGNVSYAAAALGMKRTTLQTRIKTLNLRPSPPQAMTATA